MKAYEVAKALTHLSRVLRAGPNSEIEDIGNLAVHSGSRVKKNPEIHNARGKDEKGTALALLAEMASYNKSELIDLAHQLDIPIQVRSADAVRDVLGKILRYIQENPDFRNRLAHNSANTVEGSRLAHALSILMSQ
jgi:hypothetical protein